MSMQTEYRGYRISYNENADHWNCFDIGYSHEKLSRVKAKIDAMHLKLRKASAVECYTVSMPYNSYKDRTELIEASVVDYLGPVRKRLPFEREGTGPVIDHKFAVMSKHRGNDRKSRSTVNLSDLFAPEVEERLAAIHEIEREIEHLHERKRALIQFAPRMELDAFQDLIKASDHKFEEGETP